ncbi:hypothetical protein O5D80_000519 [Batrachochytrium dendrobatidis]|nr:hypothetical protein O5D80_000519 [Batrachochytrium dendrobatidis]
MVKPASIAIHSNPILSRQQSNLTVADVPVDHVQDTSFQLDVLGTNIWKSQIASIEPVNVHPLNLDHTNHLDLSNAPLEDMFPVHNVTCPNPYSPVHVEDRTEQLSIDDACATACINYDEKTIFVDDDTVESSTTNSTNMHLKRIYLKVWRLDTLACRIISQKTLLLLRHCFRRWIHSTVTPSTHQIRQLPTNVETFGHEDWRLNIRATVHFKFALYGKVWAGWILFVKERKRQKYLEMQAISYDNENRLGMALQAWKMYSQHRFAHRRLKMMVLSKHWKLVLLKKFQIWSDRFKKQRLVKFNNSIASRVRIKNLEAKCVKLWRLALDRRLEYRHKSITAGIHATQRILKWAFLKWRLRLFDREQHLSQEKTAVWFDQCRVARVAFRCWYIKSDRAIKAGHFQIRIERAFHRHLITTKWLVWRLQFNQKKLVKLRISAFASMFEKNAKLKVFRCLNSLVSMRASAEKFSNLQLIKSVFNKWALKAIHIKTKKDEIAMVPGVSHYNSKLQCRGFHSWLFLFRSYKLQKTMKQRASNHYQSITCRKILNAFSQHARFCKQKAKLDSIAATFLNQSRIARYFLMWIRFKEHSELERRKLKHAIEFRQNKMIWRVWSMFVKNVQICKQQHEQRIMVESYYNKVLAQKMLCLWVLYTRLESKKKVHQVHATRFRYFSMMHGAFQFWHKRHIGKRQQLMHWRFAIAHHDRTVALRHLRAWNVYTKECNLLRYRIDLFQYQRELKIKLLFFGTWQNCILEIKDCSEIVESVRLLRQTTWLRKTMATWITWTHIRAFHKRKENELYADWITNKSIDLLCKCVKRWKQVYQMRVHWAELDSSAQQAYRARYQHTAWSIWRRYYKHMVWIKVTDSMQSKFRQKHLLIKTFKVWMHSRSNWRGLYYLSHVHPITFWAVSLLRKVFVTWRNEVDRQKLFKKRLENAREWHGQELISEGMRLLLQVEQRERADRLSAIAFQDRPAWSNYQWKLASKYGRRWRINSYLASRQRGSSDFNLYCRERLLDSSAQDLAHQLLILPKYTLQSTTSELDFQTIQQSTNSVDDGENFTTDLPLVCADTGKKDYSAPRYPELIKCRQRPKPREPDFLFDAVSCQFVRTNPLVDTSNSTTVVVSDSPSVTNELPTVCKSLLVDTESSSTQLVASQPTIISEPITAPQPVQSPSLTALELEDIGEMISIYEAQQTKYAQVVAQLVLFEKALERYLDGDQAVLSDPSFGCSTVLSLFDQIKHLKQSKYSFEKKAYTMRSSVTLLLQHVRSATRNRMNQC